MVCLHDVDWFIFAFPCQDECGFYGFGQALDNQQNGKGRDERFE
jgi:hypothetical protein